MSIINELSNRRKRNLIYLHFSLSEMDTDVLLSFETVMTRVMKSGPKERKNMDNSIKLSKGQLYEK